MPACGSIRASASTPAATTSAAEASFRRALALAPGDAVAQTNLASVLIDRGDFAAAEAPLSGAVADDPQFLYAAALLAYCRQHLCSWDGLAALHARVVRGIEQDESALVNAFAALSVPMSAANQLRAARRWAQSLAPPEPVAAPAPRSRGSALRLGYVSSDFRTHAVAFLATEVWERHDRARFETSAYSIAPPEDSPLGHRVAAAFSRFIDCSAEAPDDTAQRIRDDGIDILIDLNGYTTHARSEIFALRPAPVQVNWLGLSRHAGRAVVRLCDHRSLRDTRRPAGLFHRALSHHAALLRAQRHPAGGRCSSVARGLRLAGARLRVRLLQRAVQDPAAGVRRVDAPARARFRAARSGSRSKARRATICGRKPPLAASTRSG